MLVDDPNNKQVNKPDVACVIGDMKRLWRSLEGQEDVGVVGGGKGEAEGSNNRSGSKQGFVGAKGEAEGSNNRSGSKQDVIQVMGDMKQLLWKSFVGPAPDNSSI